MMRLLNIAVLSLLAVAIFGQDEVELECTDDWNLTPIVGCAFCTFDEDTCVSECLTSGAFAVAAYTMESPLPTFDRM